MNVPLFPFPDPHQKRCDDAERDVPSAQGPSVQGHLADRTTKQPNIHHGLHHRGPKLPRYTAT